MCRSFIMLGLQVKPCRYNGWSTYLMLRTHTLFNHLRSWEAYGNFCACFQSLGSSYFFFRWMFKLHQVDKSCQGKAPCESIRNSRYSAAEDPAV
jgi:hypothetical protein